MTPLRDAEFNRAHVPGFLRGVPAKEWLCVYPFVRSYEWYLLPEEERSRMLAEHGRKGAAFTGVTANTVASFALGDYAIDPREIVICQLVHLQRHKADDLAAFYERKMTIAVLVEFCAHHGRDF